MKKITEDLGQYPTKILVEELIKREAVESYIAVPYEDYEIQIGKTKVSNTGPVNIIIVFD